MNESRIKQIYAYFSALEKMGETIENLCSIRNREYRERLHPELLCMFRYLNKTQALYVCYALYVYKYGYEALTVEKADRIRSLIWGWYGGNI